MEEGSLRARKRRETMRRIQDVALRMFERNGFAAVTIERIAEEAEVSAMTVYRYFSTKENLVLHDDLSSGLVDAVGRVLDRRQDLRGAVERVLQDLPDHDTTDLEATARQRIRLVNEVPSVAGQAHIRAREAATRLAEQLVATGTDPLRARVAALAVLSALEAACDHWYQIGDASLKATTLAAVAILHQTP